MSDIKQYTHRKYHTVTYYFLHELKQINSERKSISSRQLNTHLHLKHHAHIAHRKVTDLVILLNAQRHVYPTGIFT